MINSFLKLMYLRVYFIYWILNPKTFVCIVTDVNDDDDDESNNHNHNIHKTNKKIKKLNNITKTLNCICLKYIWASA